MTRQLRARRSAPPGLSWSAPHRFARHSRLARRERELVSACSKRRVAVVAGIVRRTCSALASAAWCSRASLTASRISLSLLSVSSLIHCSSERVLLKDRAAAHGSTETTR